MSATTDEPTAHGAAPRPAGWRLTLAIIVPLVAVAVVAILARKVESSAAADPTAPLAAVVVFQPASTSAPCTALDGALPASIDNHAKRELVVPEAGVAAWGDPAVVMRCGISDPDELTCSSALTVFNGVSWLSITGDGSTTYIAVDRPVRVALTMDDSVGVGAVQAFSDVLDHGDARARRVHRRRHRP